MTRLTILLALLLCCGMPTRAESAQAKSAQAESAQANIVFIMADDMGYGDVRALNPKSTIPTPHLDRLAADGMTFTDAHTPSAVCTPTRYGVVTGRYCWRSRMKSGVLNGYSSPLIEPDRPTVASFLTQHGYATGVIGKWHLGLGFAKAADGKTFDYERPVSGGPNELGFGLSHIIPASLDFPPYVYIHNGRVTDPSVIAQPAQPFPAYLRQGPRSRALIMEDCLDELAKTVVRYIGDRAKAAEKPFFLYFPLTAPHKPVLPHPRFLGKTGLGPYGDFVAQVDSTVGRVLEAIDTAGIAENTLVIFTSDNGSFMHRSEPSDPADHVDDATVQAYRPEHHTANGVLRGTKADIWEAGHRVPFFARWPGHISKGSQCAETICLTDLFATTAEIVGEKVPEGAAPDSYSFLPLLLGKTPATPRPPVIHHSAAGMFAIRDGKWKLVLGNGSGGREAPRGKPFAKPYQLFDLSADISETKNLIEAQPDVAAELEDACRKIRE